MEKNVVELFAGVGGFRVGLNQVSSIDENGKSIEKAIFQFIWANQWEPSSGNQHAFNCYTKRFGESTSHVNKNISLVDTSNIPSHTLLVAGFPCQDYSVARTKSGEKGITGKKGVLWWEIVRILEDKRPPFILLENVDRLLKSPSMQRGRDFGIMLKTLSTLGYGVEWRVINAAEYGHPQKRRRVFIFAFHEKTNHFKKSTKESLINILEVSGLFVDKFPIKSLKNVKSCINLSNYIDIVKLSDEFSFEFESNGVFLQNNLLTARSHSVLEDEFQLRDILIQNVVDDEYFLKENQIKKFEYLKGSKRVSRKGSNGFEYNYTEGKMVFPDYLDKPGRTMLTSEGSINRSTHVVTDLITGKLRILTPIECERLNQFPDDWTNTGMPHNKRYFMMGNALVCGVVKKLGETLSNIIDKE